jgi:ribosomal protein S18 acetylase RimI-like enzyme
LLIRRATAEDAAAIQAIYAGNRNEERSVGTAYKRVDWASYVEIPHIVLLVLEDAGQVHGCLLGYDLFDWGFIELIVVRHEARGQDAGARLVDEFVLIGKDRWAAAEMLISPADERLHRYTDRLGFTKKESAVWCVRPLDDDDEDDEPS